MGDNKLLEPRPGSSRLHRRADTTGCDAVVSSTLDPFEEDLTESLREWYREQIAMVRIERTLPEAQEYRRLIAGRQRARRAPRPAPPAPPTPAPVEEQPSPDPTWLSTRAAARLLRVRNQTLYACADEAIAVEVAQETGQGGQRRHVRWRQDLLPGWWSSRSAE